eukprot:3255811-Prymnesium_polylepis.1
MQVFALCGRSSAWYAQACSFGRVRGQTSGRGGPRTGFPVTQESKLLFLRICTSSGCDIINMYMYGRASALSETSFA